MKLRTAVPHNSPVLEPERFDAARSAFGIVSQAVQDAALEFAHLSPRIIESKLTKAVISAARHSDKSAAEISHEASLALKSG